MPEPVRTMVRSTRQARAVAAALAALPGFRSAREIHAALRGDGTGAGIATVYRHLHLLAEQGRADTIRRASGETLYRQRRTSAPHCYLTCRICGHSVEVDTSEVRQWAEDAASRTGFTGVADSVQLSGLCPAHASQ
jgi:Fur family transcriptional regulator, ferric uptake regulator